MELPSYVACPYFLKMLGRRGFVSLVHFITGVAFVGVIFTGG